MIEAPRPGMPFANSTIAMFIDKKIDEMKGVKTQREIASEIGYDKPNMISCRTIHCDALKTSEPTGDHAFAVAA